MSSVKDTDLVEIQMLEDAYENLELCETHEDYLTYHMKRNPIKLADFCRKKFVPMD